MVHHKIVSAAVQPGLLPEQAKPNDEDKKVTRDTCQDASEDGKTADSSSDHKQLGVRQVEAITTAWSKELLIVMFVMLYLVTFVDALLNSVQDNLSPYVTSSFSQHGLLATTSIVSTVLGGVCNLTIAKIIDIWGRCEGFVGMVFLVVIGMVMKAVCKNVETYAAAQTIFWVGNTGMNYIISVIIADISSLQNRLILFGINGTPTIASTFAGPRIAELFYDHANFRWAFGAFLIILVAFCIPVGVVFVLSKRKAVRLGVYPERDRSRSVWESTKYYLVQFDVVGMFLTVFGWGLLLLPFSLVYYAPHGWKTPYIIAMIVLGAVLLGLFAVWEKFFAPVAYFPFHYLKDRTVLGGCLLYGFMFLSIYCWDAYYGSYLQVVHSQSIATAGYIVNSFGLASAIIGPFVGYLVHRTGDYKWLSLAGVPFCVLGTALLIHFRTPGTGVGYLVMCQVFNGISSGIWPLTGQLAIMASVGHQEIAVALALWGLFGSVGAAIGLAVAGALWNNILPQKLLELLPSDSKDQMATIFGDINVQLSYPIGSPVRNAIIGAYDDVQRKMVIAGAAFTPLCLLCVLLMKNINVRHLEVVKGKQTKGNVF